MAFVRHKTVKGKKYYQYVRNYREGGKHKQEVLCHLGPHESLAEAVDYEKQMMLECLETASSWEKEANSTKAYLFEFYGDDLLGKIPTLHEAYSRWELFQEDQRNSLFEVRDGFLFWRSELTYEEWRERCRQWNERERYEEGLLDSVRDYHSANRQIERYRRDADGHRGKLNRFTSVQQEYSK
jgi:hypothetical protein